MADDCIVAFKKFYGLDYCVRMSREFERLHDEQYEGNSFRFKEGWISPTLHLLTRLTTLRFPVRTRDHVLIHLTPPVEGMIAGEFYFQVGRQLPGRLSLKFTRRHPRGTVIIHPSVLQTDEEQRLAENPLAYLDSLRAEAAHYSPGERILQTIILLTSACACQRITATDFFMRFATFNVVPEWLPISPPPPPQLPPVSYAPVTAPIHQESRQQRSSSEGNIYNRRITEPVENDETAVLVPPNRQQRVTMTDEYKGVHSAVAAHNEIVSDYDRRPSDGSGGSRSFLQDEYAGMSEALGSLTIEPAFTGGGRRPSTDARSLPVEDYAPTHEAVGPTRDDRINSWISHADVCCSTASAGGGFGGASYLPLPVEEVNRMCESRVPPQCASRLK